MSVPFSRRCVAKLWRSVCTVTRFERPAAFAAADRHVLNHALAERAYRGHRGDLLSEGWAPTPNIPSGGRHLRRPRQARRGSGFVQSKRKKIELYTQLSWGNEYFLTTDQ